LDQAASAVEILVQSLENFLSRFKTAVCEDLTQIVDECCGTDTISFLELTDTPESYAGAAGKFVQVKSAEDGLQFFPSSFSGQAGKPVVVNATEDGFTFESFPSEFTALDKWISYFFGLVAGTPLQTIGHGGGASSPTGTTTVPALATTNASTSTFKIQFVTVNSTNQICFVIYTQLAVAIGSSQGFHWRAVVGGNTTITNQRAYWGMRAVTTNPTSVDPSSQVNIIGFGYDAGDTTLHVFHNDNAGTATDIPLGANFPVATGELFELTLDCEPGSNEVVYTITRLNTGDTASGTITTDLPATTQFLSDVFWVATAGTAGAAQMWFTSRFLGQF
jgi:hypothetical protein